jgi:hypothetical protein
MFLAMKLPIMQTDLPLYWTIRGIKITNILTSALHNFETSKVHSCDKIEKVTTVEVRIVSIVL